jgi:hypothetical protein
MKLMEIGLWFICSNLVEKISRTYSSNLEQNQEGAHLEVPFL